MYYITHVGCTEEKGQGAVLEQVLCFMEINFSVSRMRCILRPLLKQTLKIKNRRIKVVYYRYLFKPKTGRQKRTGDVEETKNEKT